MNILRIVILALVFTPSVLLSQEQNSSDFDKITKVGELLVNIINLSAKKGKTEKSDKCKTEKIESICITNETSYRLKIYLFSEGETKEKGTNLISTSSGQVCNYILKEGIYNYVVQNMADDEIYIQSQLKLGRCEELELSIKF